MREGQGTPAGQTAQAHARQAAHLVALHRAGERSTGQLDNCSASDAPPATEPSKATPDAAGAKAPREKPHTSVAEQAADTPPSPSVLPLGWPGCSVVSALRTASRTSHRAGRQIAGPHFAAGCRLAAAAAGALVDLSEARRRGGRTGGWKPSVGPSVATRCRPCPIATTRYLAQGWSMTHFFFRCRESGFPSSPGLRRPRHRSAGRLPAQRWRRAKARPGGCSRWRLALSG